MDEAFQILIAAFFFELLWAFYRAIKLIFNSRDLEMAAENVNLVTQGNILNEHNCSTIRFPVYASLLPNRKLFLKAAHLLYCLFKISLLVIYFQN